MEGCGKKIGGCGENIGGCGENLKKVAKTVNMVAEKNVCSLLHILLQCSQVDLNQLVK
jgi:archaellum component FlaC